MNTQRDISTGSGCRGRGVCGHDKPSIPEQTWPQTPQPRHPHGFTLIEMLVIVAIIALLAGMLMPAVDHFSIQRDKARTLSTINLIDGACQHYFNDFGDYPLSEDTTNYGGWTGSELIALFLTGYGPDWNNNGVPFEGGRKLDEDDGVDGFGFRLKKRGYVYGRYGAEKLPVHKGGSNRPEFVDAFGAFGNPILYYRWTGSGYAVSHNANSYKIGNTTYTITQAILNQYVQNAGAYYRKDFILISRGQNEKLEAPQGAGSDDVTNFFNE